MGIIDSVRGMFGADERTFQYVCDRCETEFESSKSDMSAVMCPECRSTKIRAASPA
ncbi:zinc ribbon domain-containing protein [Haloarchaeobius sp. FL176]|uniref:zinc ribbon domain-containing protein n=1 Tax=Haloarchaeobius sp. FL176 TaxID=2967129 RepID=UPI002147896E|nr:zinc ribbon domain-containing protein [Haloarchaeobius sp. FL176]